MNALALIILGNLRTHFANALLNRAAAQQNFQMLLPVTVHCESPPPESGYSSAGHRKAQGCTVTAFFREPSRPDCFVGRVVAIFKTLMTLAKDNWKGKRVLVTG